jgi:hypothetical protein
MADDSFDLTYHRPYYSMHTTVFRRTVKGAYVAGPQLVNLGGEMEPNIPDAPILGALLV